MLCNFGVLNKSKIMSSTRQNKISRLVQKELGDIFQKNTSSLFQGKMITVTTVRVSPDLSVARVYLSLFPVKDKEEFITYITSVESQIRFELGKRVRHQLRIVPELAFFIDDSLDYIENIDSLLK
jgi:ribosome-binding factor A